jgi:hypothetical protein
LNDNGSVTFTVTANFDAAGAKRNLETAIHRAQMKLDAQVLADSNYFIPIKTHTMENSAIINTVLGSGEVKWVTPYARLQYYGVNFDHSKQRNPNACAKWFEAAKARKMEQWRKLVDDTIKNS